MKKLLILLMMLSTSVVYAGSDTEESSKHSACKKGTVSDQEIPTQKASVSGKQSTQQDPFSARKRSLGEYLDGQESDDSEEEKEGGLNGKTSYKKVHQLSSTQQEVNLESFMSKYNLTWAQDLLRTAKKELEDERPESELVERLQKYAQDLEVQNTRLSKAIKEEYALNSEWKQKIQPLEAQYKQLKAQRSEVREQVHSLEKEDTYEGLLKPISLNSGENRVFQTEPMIDVEKNRPLPMLEEVPASIKPLSSTDQLRQHIKSLEGQNEKLFDEQQRIHNENVMLDLEYEQYLLDIRDVERDTQIYGTIGKSLQNQKWDELLNK